MAEDPKPDPLDGGQSGDRPDWLPEKFKDPETFVKSYGELENRLGELAERAKQADALEASYLEVSGRLEQLESERTRTQGQQGAEPLIAAYADAMERGDYQAALAIQAQVSTLAADARIAQAMPQLEQRLGTLASSQANEISVYARDTLEARYGEAFNEARNDMHALLEQQPHLIPEEAQYDPNVALAALDNVFKLATYSREAPAKVAPDAEAERMKLLAQTAVGAGGRIQLTGDAAKQEWDAIRAAKPGSYVDQMSGR